MVKHKTPVSEILMESELTVYDVEAWIEDLYSYRAKLRLNADFKDAQHITQITQTIKELIKLQGVLSKHGRQQSTTNK